MPVQIEPSWREVLREEFSTSYFENLIEFVKHEYKEHTCYPPGNKIFAAFDRTPFEQVKVVIIGQDPYHGAGQANGLCFSVADGVKHPPSLINIFKEISKDLQQPYPESGNLERWADQGVLLLNTVLTVREGAAGSHQKKGWEQFTDAVIKKISEERKNIVFLLWGGYAKGKAKFIDKKAHFILESGHPSPLSANRGYWFGNQHFSRANRYMQERGMTPVEW
ncbi:uracil-DNA glycosylase [Nonlabens dokdonensis]|uniref:Uracil-DNA glycosylase n=2 Tax=Nonlabens dokdonensis TaxID=328515 RepID=L7WCP5_NONDD|nr:uracil-DNA glycosylase [Nonlabens dokdonensis]AGC77839.1 uracil-DNA glycosylase [Nonlabens dokdonensis DSW-6]PZX39630.1 uracil-DNA glycosylase [Nonlabens dokdonensis]